METLVMINPAVIPKNVYNKKFLILNPYKNNIIYPYKISPPTVLFYNLSPENLY